MIIFFTVCLWCDSSPKSVESLKLDFDWKIIEGPEKCKKCPRTMKFEMRADTEKEAYA